VLLIDRSSNPVVVLLVLDVCGVMCGVVWCGVVWFLFFSLLFCSSICCLWGDLSLLGFDRAMFGDFFLKKGFLLRLEVRFGLVTCGDNRK
jgi:hypothetical protein